MEVHHHSHHPKKFKEYITEFVMLFAAVTLGFLAENIREEQVIKHQTVSVISQLRQELIMDTASLNSMKRTHARSDSTTQVVAYYLRNNLIKQNVRTFYMLTSYIFNRSGIFETNCIALDQLKYAGILKNIKEDEVRLSIEKYNITLKALEGRATREQDYMNKNIDDLRMQPFDMYVSNDSIRVSIDSIPGKIETEVLADCNGKKFRFNFLKVFVPEKLELKPFNQRDYLNKLLFLNLIRNSTQDRQYDLAFKRAVDLLTAIEKYYPETVNQNH